MVDDIEDTFNGLMEDDPDQDVEQTTDSLLEDGGE